MQKSVLAEQLRDRQVRAGHHSAETIHMLTDDEAIECYTTCPCCHEKVLDGADLESLIHLVDDADEFLGTLETLQRAERAAATLEAELHSGRGSSGRLRGQGAMESDG